MKRSLILLLSVLALGCGQGKNEATSSTDTTVVQTIREAYVYGIPLVVMDLTRRQMTNPGNPMFAPENVFKHMSRFPDADFKDVVRPNADTYYSSAFLNLEKEPVVLSVPDTRDRYYMMPMLDAYSNVFTSPGKRTTGTKAGNFLITSPKWNGTVPAGMQQIKAPTDMVWVIGRTQVNSKDDGDKVVIPIQQQCRLTPLSAWGKPAASPVAATPSDAPPKGSPNDVFHDMPVDEYFNYLNKLMVNNPPAAADKAVLDKFAAAGIGPGKKFDMTRFSPEVQTAISKIPDEAVGRIKAQLGSTTKLVNGWYIIGGTDAIGSYGTDYFQRAFITYTGLGANLREDAMYSSCGVDAGNGKLTGAANYVIHFDKGKLPPVNAFWSLTIYDEAGFFAANPINRYAIGDRSNLKPNADGSVDVYIQHQSPGKDKESNWLPAPAGAFNIMLRTYWPKEEMVNGTWKMPQVNRA